MRPQRQHIRTDHQLTRVTAQLVTEAFQNIGQIALLITAATQKAGFRFFVDIFAGLVSFILLINFGRLIPALRVAANRYKQGVE